MANYSCTIRTNYFRVKDEDSFRELMSRVYGSEDSVDIFERRDNNGTLYFGFGCYGGIGGLRNAASDEDDDADESAYDEFLDKLQKCVAEDDAIIIFEAGSEKLRYVTGEATIITSTDYKFFNIIQAAKKEAEFCRTRK